MERNTSHLANYTHTHTPEVASQSFANANSALEFLVRRVLLRRSPDRKGFAESQRSDRDREPHREHEARCRRRLRFREHATAIDAIGKISRSTGIVESVECGGG